MKKEIYCERCSQLIEYRDEIVTVSHFGLSIRPYHKACYAEEAQGVSGLFLGQPTNGTSGKMSGFMFLVAALACLFIGQLGIYRWLLVAFCLYGAAMPLISRNLYERHLKE